MMKTTLILAAFFLIPGSSFAFTSGFVTPAELTITFTSASLITADNKNITMLSGSYPTTFHKTDADFSAISLGGITAPEGRFIGVQVCYNTDRSVKLNGDFYHGTTGSGYTDGTTQIWSKGTNAVTSGSIQTSIITPTT